MQGHKHNKMKFVSLILSTLLLAVAFASAATDNNDNDSSSAAIKHDALLVNGAELTVDLLTPSPNAVYAQDAALTIQGAAHLGQGTATVAYIYVIDSSGSTGFEDAPCASILDCTQQFFQALHRQALDDGSAKLVGVIDFDSSATVTAELQDPYNTTAIDEAIEFTYPSGGTSCSAALETATHMAEEAMEQPTIDTVMVFFGGDGGCTADDGFTPADSATVRTAAEALGTTDAIVHTIAIGDAVNCNATFFRPELGIGGEFVENHLFTTIPQNGGSCISVTEPIELMDFTNDLIGTSLETLQIKYDGGAYRDMTSDEISGDHVLPLAADVNVAFQDVNVPHVFAPGMHSVCVRATAADTHQDGAMAEDCRDFVIQKAPATAPTAAPSKAGKIVAMVFFILGMSAILLVVIRHFRSSKERDSNEISNTNMTTRTLQADVGVVVGSKDAEIPSPPSIV